MHKIGLHGQAIIPMLVGMGCNVLAMFATRVIESRREKLILGTIIIMAIPCSAQMAVIIGTVGNYGGILYVIAILAILLGLVSTTWAAAAQGHQVRADQPDDRDP